MPLECESSALPFELVPLGIAENKQEVDRPNFIVYGISITNQVHFPVHRFLEFKYLLFFVIAHVRMAERSKAPHSRVEPFLTGVFWSTNVGVGSHPTSDKRFRNSAILKYDGLCCCKVVESRTQLSDVTVLPLLVR